MAGPKHTIKFGAVKATIWENKFNYKGKDILNQTVTVSKSYRDKDGNWKDSGSFKVNEIPKAIEALREAYLLMIKGELGESEQPKEGVKEKSEDVEAFL